MQKSLLRTFIYSDAFSYPLTKEETARWLIKEKAAGGVKEALRELISHGRIEQKGEYYFLKGKGEIVELRKKREEYSKEKWQTAKKAAERLKRLPLIKMIGVTGALAMGNCREDDDIDFLVIAARDSLWLARLLIFLLAPLLGIKRRKPAEKAVKDKICFNLFLEENHLKIEPENLFLAHEILQMKPVFNQGKTHEKFLWENRWVKQYLPNAVSFNNETIEQSNNSLMVSLLHCFIAIFNKMTFFAQYQYMKPKMTIEKVSLHQAFFHPQDLQEKTLAGYEARMKEILKQA